LPAAAHIQEGTTVSDVPGNYPDTDYPPITSEARNWAMLCHLSALAGLVVPGVAMFVGPLIVWLLKRNEHPFVDEHGKEALNFQISMLIYLVLLSPTICILIGFVLLPALLLANVVFVIIASMRASNGEAYRYPLTIRLVR
jgi:uncharacterized Tic20 family protein